MEAQQIAEVRRCVFAGLRVTSVPVDEKVVEMLVGRVTARDGLRDPKGFAYVVARNWAIDQAQRARAIVHRLEKEDRARQAEAARLREEEMRQEAEQEFHRLRPQILATTKPSQWRHLDMVFASAIRLMTDRECAALFPGISRDVRYQWKHRGIELLWPHASDTLKHVIGRKQR